MSVTLMPLTEEIRKVLLMGAIRSKLDFDQLGLPQSCNFAVDSQERGEIQLENTFTSI